MQQGDGQADCGGTDEGSLAYSKAVLSLDGLFFGAQAMVELYLLGTDERQFLIWLHTYCRQKSASDIVYKFTDGWSYKLHYPALGAQTSVSFTARVYRVFRQNEAKETTETMANNLEAIKLEWHEVGDRLKVTISPHAGLWVMPPLDDLLTNIRKSWPEAVSDNWT
jgi:hypothetical protein